MSMAWPRTRPDAFCAEFLAVVAATVWPITETSLAVLRTHLSPPLDWDHLIAVVHRQRVAGLVHASFSALGSPVPAEVLDAIRVMSVKAVRQNLFAARETHRIGLAFEEAGIDVAMLKGLALGLLAYGDLARRHSKDIDLLVHPEGIARADLLLQQSGWRRVVPPESWEEREVDVFRVTRSHFEYAHAGSPLQLELHWRLAENLHFGIPFPPARTWQTVGSGGLRVRTLALVDHVEYLCTHGAAHAWSRLKWLADVHAMLGQHDGLGEALVARAAKMGNAAAVGQALSLCHRLYGLPLPRGTASGLQVRVLTWIAADALTSGCAAGELLQDRRRNAVVHLSHFLLSARPRYLWNQLRNELLMPPAWTHVSPSRSRRALHGLRRIWPI